MAGMAQTKHIGAQPCEAAPAPLCAAGFAGEPATPEAADATPSAGIAGALADFLRADCRAAFASSPSNSSRHTCFKLADEALGRALRSNFRCSRNRMSHPASSGRRSRKASRAKRLTTLRVTARGAYFLPTTRPSRAASPVGRPYSTKCAERAQGRKRKNG